LFFYSIAFYFSCFDRDQLLEYRGSSRPGIVDLSVFA